MQCESRYFLEEPSTVEIREEVAHLIDKANQMTVDRAMSVKTLEQLYDRIGRALGRKFAGEHDVVVDS
jgi:hypothetical protein